jgi:hypothetical protein
MTTFKRYPKIHRLGKEEVEGILEGECHIEEKIDGANASIWLDKRGEVTCGSRNRELSGGFNGLVDYVKTDAAINLILHDHPTWRLYGEWLVRHTIGYNESAYKKFYLFDITVVRDGEEVEEFLTKEEVIKVADYYNIPRPEYHGSFKNPTSEQILEHVGKSVLGEKGEGVVIKNHEFRDKFGSHNYAKIVTENFKEDNAVNFGGNNKHSESYWELYVVNKYMSLARVEKVMHKIQPLVDKRLDLEHIPRISNTCYHDMLTEEIWEIQDKVESLNFRSLKRIALKKAVAIYKEILSGDISVAHARTIDNEGAFSIREVNDSEGADERTEEESQ